MKKKTFGTRKLAVMAIFAAIAAVLMFFEIPLPFAPEFYKLDVSEVPVLIGTFCYGPAAGMVIELVKILVKFLLKGTVTAGVGELGNFLIGCSLLVPAGLTYKFNKNKKGALLGLLAGTLSMTAVGSLLNVFILLPVYAAAFHMPIDSLVEMGAKINSSITSVSSLVMLCVVPFNLLKGVVVGVITFLLYKRVSRLVKSEQAAVNGNRREQRSFGEREAEDAEDSDQGAE